MELGECTNTKYVNMCATLFILVGRNIINSSMYEEGINDHALDQTLWYHFLARSSSQQHGAKENVCTPRMETNFAPLCSQDVKIQQKGVSRHYLTPEIVARTIRHHLVAAFYCSANMYDNICPGTIYENDTHKLYV